VPHPRSIESSIDVFSKEMNTTQYSGTVGVSYDSEDTSFIWGMPLHSANFGKKEGREDCMHNVMIYVRYGSL